MKDNNFENFALNKEICVFIGAFIGDGYMGIIEWITKIKNQYVICISGNKELDENYFKNYLGPLIKIFFHLLIQKLYYRLQKRWKHTILVLRIYSKELYKIFLKFGFESGQKIKNNMNTWQNIREWRIFESVYQRNWWLYFSW